MEENKEYDRNAIVIKCSNCGNVNNNNAITCKSCNYNLNNNNDNNENQNNKQIMVCYVVILFTFCLDCC